MPVTSSSRSGRDSDAFFCVAAEERSRSNRGWNRRYRPLRPLAAGVVVVIVAAPAAERCRIARGERANVVSVDVVVVAAVDDVVDHDAVVLFVVVVAVAVVLFVVVDVVVAPPETKSVLRRSYPSE